METLRTWEHRYGFPVPERKPSGHRVYPATLVPRLRRIAAALGRGHRAAEVVAASDTVLEALLCATTADQTQPRTQSLLAVPGDVSDLMDTVRRCDSDRLTRILLGDWARLEPLEFLTARVAPLVYEVGAAWEAGRIDVRHEHFAAERVGDVLRALRMRLEKRAQGALVVMATMPGELHGLGLQMAALAAAAMGCRVLYLGTDVPLSEICAIVDDTEARLLAVSLSTATPAQVALAQLTALRAKLPEDVHLLVGGAGALSVPGLPGAGDNRIETVRSFADFADRLTTFDPALPRLSGGGRR